MQIVRIITFIGFFLSSAVMATTAPSEYPTAAPSEFPTTAPSTFPTEQPTEMPTEAPTLATVPSEMPTLSEVATVNPTEMPTEMPTEAPTFVDIIVNFNVSLTLGGLSSNVLGEQDELAITQTLAISSGIGLANADDVTLFSYEEVERRRLRTILHGLSASYTLEALNGFTVHTDDFPAYADNPEGLYDSLSANIMAAIASGNFTATLRARSLALGATATATCTSASAVINPAQFAYPAGAPTPGPTTMPTAAPSLASTLVSAGSSSDNGLTDGEIAGCVIGSIVGAILIFAAVYLLLNNARGKDGMQPVNKNEVGHTQNNLFGVAPVSEPAHDAL